MNQDKKKEQEKPKSEKKGQKRKQEIKKREADEKRKAARAKRWDEFWVPILMIAAVVVAIVILIFVSMKSGERAKLARNRDMCILQMKGDVSEVLVGYHQESGRYPDKMNDIKVFLESNKGNVGASDEPKKMQEELYNMWRRFYCPSDAERNTQLYLYEKPADSAAPDFVIMKCPVHPSQSFLTLKDLYSLEVSLPNAETK